MPDNPQAAEYGVPLRRVVMDFWSDLCQTCRHARRLHREAVGPCNTPTCACGGFR